MSCPDPAREMNISLRAGFAAICGREAVEYMMDDAMTKTGRVKRAGVTTVLGRVRLASSINSFRLKSSCWRKIKMIDKGALVDGTGRTF